MNKTHKILVVIAILQLVLLVLVQFDQRTATSIGKAPLLGFSPDQITGVVVEKTASKTDAMTSIRMNKKADAWSMPDADDFQLDTEQVVDTLQKLGSISVSNPVARSIANHNTLLVGEKNYSKRVKLTYADGELDLFLGEGKGRSMYIRRGNSADVYLVEGLTTYDIGHEVTQYVDPTYFSIEDLLEVNLEINTPDNVNSAHLYQDETGNWMADGLDGKTIDQSRVRALLTSVRSARMVRPVGKTLRPEFGLGNPRARVSVKGKEKSLEFIIGSDTGDFTYMKASNKEDVIVVRKYTLEALLRFKKEQLVDTTSQQQPTALPGAGFPNP